MKFSFSILLLVLCSLEVRAQKLFMKKSIYFESAKYNLDSTAKKTLERISDTLKSFAYYRIVIRGNTDNVGDSIYNQRLSEQRVLATQKYFKSMQIPDSAFSLAFLGETKPLADNESEPGKQKNRRVDILITFTRKPLPDTASKIISIKALYRLLERAPQSYCINPDRDTMIRGQQGSMVLIKANTFRRNSACPSNCINFLLKEDFLKSDIILDDLSTLSNGKLLESQAMVFTDAKDCLGNPVSINRGRNITIMTPADSIIPNAKIFRGNRTPHDSIMNWTLLKNSRLSGFSLNDLNNCFNVMCGSGGPECDCRFFTCRIIRFDETVRGWFNRCQRMENKIFRKQLRICKLEKRGKASKIPEQVKKIAEIEQKFPNCTSNGSRGEFNVCKQLWDAFNLYGVENMDDFLLAINKNLLDSFNVKTMAELNDTLRKLRDIQIYNDRRKEMDKYSVKTIEALNDTLEKLRIIGIENDYTKKTINIDDLNYYIFSTQNLGWSNVDVFANYEGRLVNMSIDLRAEINIDCKIVMADRRVVIPATVKGKTFRLDNIPSGKSAWIVALKYDNGKAYLFIRKITTGTDPVKVEFREYTLDELKLQLKVLNTQ